MAVLYYYLVTGDSMDFVEELIQSFEIEDASDLDSMEFAEELIQSFVDEAKPDSGSESSDNELYQSPELMHNETPIFLPYDTDNDSSSSGDGLLTTTV